MIIPLDSQHVAQLVFLITVNIQIPVSTADFCEKVVRKEPRATEALNYVVMMQVRITDRSNKNRRRVKDKHSSIIILFSDLCFVFLEQLQTEAGDLLLDAHHDVGVVLISLKLVGEAHHAVPHKVILPCKVRLDCLRDKWSLYWLIIIKKHPPLCG